MSYLLFLSVMLKHPSPFQQFQFARSTKSAETTFDTIDTEVAEDTLLDEATADGWHLVLYNDEHNSFDHVIEMLVRVCNHDATQAEQCAMLVHFKGKCTVMSGAYDDLEPKCTKLLSADLTAEIEA